MSLRLGRSIRKGAGEQRQQSELLISKYLRFGYFRTLRQSATPSTHPYYIKVLSRLGEGDIEKRKKKTFLIDFAYSDA